MPSYGTGFGIYKDANVTPVGTGGIYAGSGNVPLSTVATIGDTLTFAGGSIDVQQNKLLFNNADTYIQSPSGQDLVLGSQGDMYLNSQFTITLTEGLSDGFFNLDAGDFQFNGGSGVASTIFLVCSGSVPSIQFSENGVAFNGNLKLASGLGVSRTWTLPDADGTLLVGSGFITLTDAATITWDYLDGSNAEVTLTATRTLDTPSNVSDGDYGTLKIIQDGTGGWGLTLPATFQVVNGGNSVITLTATANAVDMLCWVYDGTNFYVTLGLNFT